ncbi:hypothetical protein TNCV_2633501 [Trichonephila clavipes]|nr:hypothetical protein TNCV_2633501 [Trichonephila clavipes]
MSAIADFKEMSENFRLGLPAPSEEPPRLNFKKRTKIRSIASDSERALRMNGKGDGGQHEKKPKTGEGRGNKGGKANQDATWAGQTLKLGETVRTTNDTDTDGSRSCKKKGTRNRNKKRLVWFTVR